MISDFQPQQNLGMYLKTLAHPNILIMNSNNFGTGFIKIGHTVPKLCTWKVSKRHSKSMEITFAFVALRIFPCEFNFCESMWCAKPFSRLTIPGQIRSADFESGDCFLQECTYVAAG